MQLLKNNSIKSKKDIYALYLPNMTHRAIKIEIEYATQLRSSMPKQAHLIHLSEVVIFLSSNDAPAGFELDPEMQKRVDDYREIFGKRPTKAIQEYTLEELRKEVEKRKNI